jgi:hypothetical protein
VSWIIVPTLPRSEQHIFLAVYFIGHKAPKSRIFEFFQISFIINLFSGFWINISSTSLSRGPWCRFFNRITLNYKILTFLPGLVANGINVSPNGLMFQLFYKILNAIKWFSHHIIVLGTV